MEYREKKRNKLTNDILSYVLGSLFFGGLYAGSIKYSEYKEKKALDAIRNYDKTIEYVVQENDSWDKIRKKFIPSYIRDKMDIHTLNEYLAKELNGKENYVLQKNEGVLVPEYSKKQKNFK